MPQQELPKEPKVPEPGSRLNVVLATMQAVISIIAAVVSNLAVIPAISESKMRFILGAMAFVFVVFAIAGFVAYFRRRTVRVIVLRAALLSAFSEALDRTALNPAHKK